ncbi:MAG: DHH family phosphoesterase [Clostridiales bacterium]|nr:DHH family phosphoesterase [Clostridiales bacterium]
MKIKEVLHNHCVAVSALAALLFVSVSLLFFNITLAAVSFAVFAGITIFALLRYRNVYGHIQRIIKSVESSMDFSEREAVFSFPLPVLAANADGRIEWYNDLFERALIGDSRLSNLQIEQFTSGIKLDELAMSGVAGVTCAGRSYSVYINRIFCDGAPLYLLYFADDTALKATAEEYEKSRPVVAVMAIDNIDDIYQNNSDSEYTSIVGGMERLIEEWCVHYGALMRKYAGGRFLMITEERHLQDMIADRFYILDRIREYSYNDKPVGATMSIGVGRSAQFRELESLARQSLDMAFGRGGDQAVIHNKDGFDFYGGVSKGVEKRTKVKSRIVASAISELISGSGNVLIMGHRFSDLDSLGASLGMYCLCQAYSKPVNIVIDESTTLASPLIERVRSSGLKDLIISPAQAAEAVNADTLLIVTDTHRPDFLESRQLYESVKSKIVIDHHRKMADFIGDAVLFHHEPYASSASEMVAELLQYVPVKMNLSQVAADGLLAGIMLDTKDFVLRAGVKTFEAAAYLRSKNADTVAVKKLFSGSMEEYMLKNRIVSSAEKYRDCAIASLDGDIGNSRIACAKAADELLNIEGVKASFVIFMSGSTANISARSLGGMNVQIIMEALGGGGHQTMAAAQLKDTSSERAKDMLVNAINEKIYF